jgi:hypothetical protein
MLFEVQFPSIVKELKDLPYAVPLFSHLESLTTIDENARKRTRGHIALSFHHHKINLVDASDLENRVFAEFKVTFNTFFGKLLTLPIQLIKTICGKCTFSTGNPR